MLIFGAKIQISFSSKMYAARFARIVVKNETFLGNSTVLKISISGDVVWFRVDYQTLY